MTVKTKLNSIVIIAISAILALYIYLLNMTYVVEKEIERVEKLSVFKEQVSTLNLVMEYYFSTQNERYANTIDSILFKLDVTKSEIESFENINVVHNSLPSITNAYGLIRKIYEKDTQYADAEEREELLNRSKVLIRSDLNQLLSISFMVSFEHFKEIHELQITRRWHYAAIIFPVIIFLILIGYTVRKQILKSLQKLKKGAKAIASGNLDKRIDLNQKDEFGELADQFNLMAEQIENFIEKERKLANELDEQSVELKSSNEELEKFAYIASHDLQEPLRMIISFLTMLEKNYSPQLDDKAKQYIFYAVDGANRLRQIILDLLEFSRAGNHSHDLEEINLNDLVEEVKQLQAKVIQEKKAKIQYDKLPNIKANRPPILQVFHNLIGNALKYSQKDVPVNIKISCEIKDDFCEFRFTDNGIGILPEHKDKIFVIFQRLHSRSDYSGTGLGLSIVKKIIDNLGGKIWVESDGLGKGSTFYFSLPAKYIIE